MNTLVWIIVLLVNNVLAVTDLNINKPRRVKLHPTHIELKDEKKNKYYPKQTRGNNAEMLRKLSFLHLVNVDGFQEVAILKTGFMSVNNETYLFRGLQKLYLISRQYDTSSPLKKILNKLGYSGQTDFKILPNNHIFEEYVDRLKLNNGLKAELHGAISPVIIIIAKQTNHDWKELIKDSRWIEDNTKEEQIRSNKKYSTISYTDTPLKKGHTIYDQIVYRVKADCTNGKYYKVDLCNLCFCSKRILECTAVRCTKNKVMLSKGLNEQRFYQKLQDEATACEPGAHKVVKDGNDNCPCTCIVPSVLYCPLCPAVDRMNITKNKIKKLNKEILQNLTNAYH